MSEKKYSLPVKFTKYEYDIINKLAEEEHRNISAYLNHLVQEESKVFFDYNPECIKVYYGDDKHNLTTSEIEIIGVRLPFEVRDLIIDISNKTNLTKQFIIRLIALKYIYYFQKGGF